ncbi:hypothetical protein [Hymenobacter cellulosivorans]|uniref:Uncharacterized protein n=1 Tax=Hymenobacter cellulosivorans TaxID=2932249 RepID=A0ABY4FEQ2_9BACT|nr:hypothetical protein [Hymenobacter cellulosivorans]UOQ55084.1 hypothetical protein MUN80_10065 [Hymenobacter cellulosivorans]
MDLLFVIGFIVLFWLALRAIYWIFSAESVGQGVERLASTAAAGTVLFWLVAGLLMGIGLEEDAKERQRTTGESLFGG